MLRRVFQLLVVLLPLGLFALALQPVQALMFGGQAARGIVLLLLALAVLAVVEGLLFRYWVLPGWSDKVAERLYAGSYNPEDDALAQLVDRMLREKDASALPRLRMLVQSQPRRLRGWLELARLQLELLHDAAAALTTLEEGAAMVRDAEDAALLLYRAGSMCELALHDSDRARSFWRQAADRYPATVYGAKSAARMEEVCG